MFEDRASILELFSSIFSAKIIKLIFIGVCFLVGLGGIFYGLVGLINTTQTEILSCPDVDASSEVSSDSCVPWGKVFVDVSGAVNEPGLYQLETGSRVARAIKIAGDFSPRADKDYINHQLNLAKEITDGDKIYIPFIEEKVNSQEISNTFSELEPNGSLVDQEYNKVSINQATQDELESLPDIGEKRAQDIIQNRPYSSVNELLSKEILTETLFEKIETEIQL